MRYLRQTVYIRSELSTTTPHNDIFLNIALVLILYFAHGVPLSNTPLTFVIKRRLETLACDEVLKTCKWAIKRD